MFTAKPTKPPEFSSRVDPERGVLPTRLPEEKKILRGMADAHPIEVRNIIGPVLSKLHEKERKKFRELFRQFKDSPEYSKSVATVELILQLLKENGRLNKRLRGKTDAEENLLFAGLVHTLDPKFLREIRLTEIADIIACDEQPKSPSQFLLYGAIEYVKAHDRKPTLVLLGMIQEKDWDTKQQLFLACLILDILELKDKSLSSEEKIRARDIAQAYIK